MFYENVEVMRRELELAKAYCTPRTIELPKSFELDLYLSLKDPSLVNLVLERMKYGFIVEYDVCRLKGQKHDILSLDLLEDHPTIASPPRDSNPNFTTRFIREELAQSFFGDREISVNEEINLLSKIGR